VGSRRCTTQANRQIDRSDILWDRGGAPPDSRLFFEQNGAAAAGRPGFCLGCTLRLLCCFGCLLRQLPLQALEVLLQLQQRAGIAGFPPMPRTLSFAGFLSPASLGLGTRCPNPETSIGRLGTQCPNPGERTFPSLARWPPGMVHAATSLLRGKQADG
jgi:hypothetical protein